MTREIELKLDLTPSAADALIELVLDRGEATIDERISPICEIELELKSGKLSALIALEKFQDLLGSLNDRATAPAVLERLGPADLDDAAVLLAGHKKGALLKAAADAYDALSDAHPFWR